MYEIIYDFENLHKAYLKARRGKGEKNQTAKFDVNLLEAIALLQKQLRTGTYKPSEYTQFKVYEPKERIVKTNSFKDKVVQHSLCDNIIEPVFGKSFIYDNYASQKGKGTDVGLNRLAEYMRRHYRLNGCGGWVLKCDIRKYFYNIRHEPLKAMVRKLINDPKVLWLIDIIIDSTEGDGIPIGNQTSQFFALLYLSGLDHYIKEKLGIKMYGRYMDDFYLIHPDKEYLKECREKIAAFLVPLGLELNEKTNIFPLKNGIDFLGYHTYLTDTGKVIKKIRRKSKNNVRRRLKKMKKLLVAGKIEKQSINQSYQSWRGHARRGNCYHLVNDMDALYNKLFKEV